MRPPRDAGRSTVSTRRAATAQWRSPTQSNAPRRAHSATPGCARIAARAAVPRSFPPISGHPERAPAHRWRWDWTRPHPCCGGPTSELGGSDHDDKVCHVEHRRPRPWIAGVTNHGGAAAATGVEDAPPQQRLLGAVLDAGSRGGATVICDVPRRSTPAAETALEAADLVVVIAPADVRSCAAAAAITPWVSSSNPNAGAVVRGPSRGPGTGRCRRDRGTVLLAAMRPQRGVGCARARRVAIARRSPLAPRRDVCSRCAHITGGERRMSTSLIDGYANARGRIRPAAAQRGRRGDPRRVRWRAR